MNHDTLHTLSSHEMKNTIANHHLFALKPCPYSFNDVELIIGQWYHPMRNFNYFLASLIAHTKDINIQSFVCKILWQESGMGLADRSHVKLYEETMSHAGFNPQKIKYAAPLPSTIKLIEGYKKAAKDALTGLGFLYGTEVIDLTMVSFIGDIVRAYSQTTALPWVDIHVQQEPDHVTSVNDSLSLAFTSAEKDKIIHSAETAWTLWKEYWDGIQSVLSFKN